MNKLIILTAIATLNVATVFGQCTALFSFAAYFETVTFFNQSNISNAHYFWNFGDGTGSNYQNPIHKFPASGNYLVTLFAKDTVNNCSTFYEYWVIATQYSPDSCQRSISDSVFTYQGNDFVRIIDLSSNCANYVYGIDCGPGSNFPQNNWIFLGNYWQTIPFHMVGRIQYSTHDTINNTYTSSEAYKTSLHNYSSALNFGDCSANYEFIVISEDSIGQRILFTAMNKTAVNYQWYIAGFGNPITSNNDTISQYYHFGGNDLKHVGLMIEGSTGCHDTLFQNILIRKNVVTITSINEIEKEVNYNLYPNPFTDHSTLSFPSISDKTTFTLYNTNGQLVKTIGNITDGQLTIYRDNLATGLYYFMLRTNDSIIATGKLMTK